jgi:hypothetical protein
MTASGSGRALSLVAAFSLALGVVACGETSKVDPDAVVSISGQIRAPSGDPLADRPVRLATGASGSDLALAVVTLGLACAADICDDTVRTARTQDDGAYRIEVKGRDTQTSFGNVRTQMLSASAAPTGLQVSGPSVAARFVVQTERVQLPPLRLVDPGLSLEAAPGQAVASWTPARGAPYTLAFETDSVVPVWQVTTAEPTATVDSRVLEGSSGRVVLSGQVADQIEGSDLDVTWRSPGLGYATEGAPLSRGATCRYGSPRSASPNDAGAVGCGLTDGDLFSTDPPTSNCPKRPSQSGSRRPCKTPRNATIEMDSAVTSDLIVVRGCEGTCLVEVSTDGRRYRPVGSATDSFADMPVPATSVRSVRVGLGTAGLREVSIWGPETQLEPGLEPVSEAEVDELRSPYEDGEPTGSSRPIVVVIGALLVIVVIALAYRAGSRRASRGES